MTEQIRLVHTTATEIARLVEAMESVIEGESEHTVLMAALAIAICMQAPGINSEQLAHGIRGASEWIALYASSIETPVDPSRMN